MNEHEYGMKQKIEYIESYIKYDDGYQFLGASRLIRCKDCKYSVDEYDDGECYCNYTKCLQYVKDWNHYCAWAEPKVTE